MSASSSNLSASARTLPVGLFRTSARLSALSGGTLPTSTLSGSNNRSALQLDSSYYTGTVTMIKGERLYRLNQSIHCRLENSQLRLWIARIERFKSFKLERLVRLLVNAYVA